MFIYRQHQLFKGFVTRSNINGPITTELNLRFEKISVYLCISKICFWLFNFQFKKYSAHFPVNFFCSDFESNICEKKLVFSLKQTGQRDFILLFLITFKPFCLHPASRGSMCRWRETRSATRSVPSLPKWRKSRRWR